MSEQIQKQKRGFLDAFMDGIEKAANKLPTPFTLFLCLFLITAVLSFVLSFFSIEMTHPSTGASVTIRSFFTSEGILWLIQHLVSNFVGYAPLGTVLVMTLGIGLCEETGMVRTFIKKAMSNVPAKLVPYAVALVGVLGNIASNSAYVVLPPIGAITFMGVGLHPIGGMISAFAGVGMGYSANLMVTSDDALLAGITNSVLEGFTGGSYVVDVTCNWFFMIGSTLLVMFVVGTVDILIVEPRLGKYTGRAQVDKEPISSEENRALGICGLCVLVYLAVIGVGVYTGLLLNPETGGIAGSPLLTNLVALLFGLFCTAGISFGIAIGAIKTERDATRMLAKSIGTVASYITVAFIASQFTNLFSWTNLGTIVAISGANLLQSIGFTGLPMMVVFIIMVATINLIMGSASSKWTLLAPIFLPMFMMLGYQPGFIQAVYRVGDSSTNSLSPMSTYLFMMLASTQSNYDEDATLGTFISNLMPHSMCILCAWILFIVTWSLLGLPFGPGVYTYLPEGFVL